MWILLATDHCSLKYSFLSVFHLSEVHSRPFSNRNLREARDNALEEKERACANEKEIASKYDVLQSG